MFCGFEIGNIQNFKSKNFTENALYDLEKWDTFEKENPSIFAGMYQFWCQKKLNMRKEEKHYDNFESNTRRKTRHQ